MAVKMMPTMATLTKKNQIVETSDGKIYSKICVAIDNMYFWCAVFGATATYINEYADIGAQLFLEDWNMKKSDDYYDFAVLRTKIIRNGADR